MTRRMTGGINKDVNRMTGVLALSRLAIKAITLLAIE